MSDLCTRDHFSDGEPFEFMPLTEALVLERSSGGKCLTNVPHLVVHHSPDGFEFGYMGSAPADLALNICQCYLNSIGYQGEKTECFDGKCWSLAWVLHQDFKARFIAGVWHGKGARIPFAEIADWFNRHITAELKQKYSGVTDELAN